GWVRRKGGLPQAVLRTARGDKCVDGAGRRVDHRVTLWISPSIVLRSLGSSWSSTCTLSTACSTVVILATEGAPHLGQGRVGELARQVHGDLPGECDGLRPILRLEI